MNEVVQGLALLKDAFKSKMEELDLTKPEYWKLKDEITDIEYLIEGIERIETRRQREYERRFRHLKRVRDKEVRRRIYLGLRMDSVRAGGNSSMEFPGTSFVGGRYGKKNIRRYRLKSQKV